MGALPTHLSRRLMCAAFLPSTYSVLGLPGRSRTTPSKAAPRFGAEMSTLFAWGRAPKALRGKSALSSSRAPFRCLLLIATTLLPSSSASSGVSGGVAASDGGTSLLPRMSRGGVGNGNAAGAKPGGVEGKEMPLESLKLSEPNDDSVEVRSLGESEGVEGKDDARLSVTQSDDPLSGGHFAEGMSKAPLFGVRDASAREACDEYSPQARRRTR